MTATPTPKTRLLYFEDSERFECEARVLAVGEAVDWKQPGCHVVVLDQTICYPQGGGQPSDTGVIVGGDGETEMKVLEARVDRATSCVQHVGSFSGAALGVGDQVRVRIDVERRVLHNRLHSAGHLVDACMAALGYPSRATKAYHFPDSPYCEYSGDIPADQVEPLRARLEAKAAELISGNGPVEVRLDVSAEEAKSLCGDLDSKYFKEPTLRLVTLGGYAVPCGGTHVRSLDQLKGVKVPKIKITRGKQLIRVQYKLVD